MPGGHFSMQTCNNIGQCSCYAGFSNPTCEGLCFYCQNGGICSVPNTCDCSSTGYWGKKSTIYNFAVMIAPIVYVYLCFIQYTYCSAICDLDCLNGGNCTATNTCDCRGTGFSGSQCQTRKLQQLLMA